MFCRSNASGVVTALAPLRSVEADVVTPFHDTLLPPKAALFPRTKYRQSGGRSGISMVPESVACPWLSVKLLASVLPELLLAIFPLITKGRAAY